MDQVFCASALANGLSTDKNCTLPRGRALSILRHDVEGKKMADKTIGGGLSAATIYNDREDRGGADISTSERGALLRKFKPRPAACTNAQTTPCRPRAGQLKPTLELPLMPTPNLIGNDRQLTGGREPGPVIPGLPARAEPGIQGLLEYFLDSRFRYAAPE